MAGVIDNLILGDGPYVHSNVFNFHNGVSELLDTPFYRADLDKNIKNLQTVYNALVKQENKMYNALNIKGSSQEEKAKKLSEMLYGSILEKNTTTIMNGIAKMINDKNFINEITFAFDAEEANKRLELNIDTSAEDFSQEVLDKFGEVILDALNTNIKENKKYNNTISSLQKANLTATNFNTMIKQLFAEGFDMNKVMEELKGAKGLPAIQRAIRSGRSPAIKELRNKLLELSGLMINPKNNFQGYKKIIEKYWKIYIDSISNIENQCFLGSKKDQGYNYITYKKLLINELAKYFSESFRRNSRYNIGALAEEMQRLINFTSPIIETNNNKSILLETYVVGDLSENKLYNFAKDKIFNGEEILRKMKTFQSQNRFSKTDIIFVFDTGAEKIPIRIQSKMRRDGVGMLLEAKNNDNIFMQKLINTRSLEKFLQVLTTKTQNYTPFLDETDAALIKYLIANIAWLEGKGSLNIGGNTNEASGLAGPRSQLNKMFSYAVTDYLGITAQQNLEDVAGLKLTSSIASSSNLFFLFQGTVLVPTSQIIKEVMDKLREIDKELTAVKVGIKSTLPSEDAKSFYLRKEQAVEYLDAQGDYSEEALLRVGKNRGKEIISNTKVNITAGFKFN